MIPDCQFWPWIALPRPLRTEMQGPDTISSRTGKDDISVFFNFHLTIPVLKLLRGFVICFNCIATSVTRLDL